MAAWTRSVAPDTLGHHCPDSRAPVLVRVELHTPATGGSCPGVHFSVGTFQKVPWLPVPWRLHSRPRAGSWFMCSVCLELRRPTATLQTFLMFPLIPPRGRSTKSPPSMTFAAAARSSSPAFISSMLSRLSPHFLPSLFRLSLPLFDEPPLVPPPLLPPCSLLQMAARQRFV